MQSALEETRLSNCQRFTRLRVVIAPACSFVFRYCLFILVIYTLYANWTDICSPRGENYLKERQPCTSEAESESWPLGTAIS